MTHRPDDPPPQVPRDEYWELLQESLRAAVGRPAEPEARPQPAVMTRHPEAPKDDYWALLRGSLRSVVGRPAEEHAPEPAVREEPTQPPPAPPGAASPPAEQSGPGM
jgi:hypothetical protein